MASGRHKIAAVAIGAGVGCFIAGAGSVILYQKFKHHSYIDLREELSLVRHELAEIRSRLDERNQKRRENANQSREEQQLSNDFADFGLTFKKVGETEGANDDSENFAALTDTELNEFFDAPEWPTQVHFRIPSSGRASPVGRSISTEPPYADSADSSTTSLEELLSSSDEEDKTPVGSLTDLSSTKTPKPQQGRMKDAGKDQFNREESQSTSTGTMFSAASRQSSKAESFTTCKSSNSISDESENGSIGTGKGAIDIRIVYERTERWLNGGEPEDTKRAYCLLKSVYDAALNDARPVDGEFLWRLSRATFSYGQLLGNQKEERKLLIFEAKDHAFEALKLDPNSADVHKWCALTLGTASSDFMGVSDKIKHGYDFKMHIDKALELRPNDATLHYLAGRWCFGVASLSWIERKIATTLFTEPPVSTYEDALREFLKAENLTSKPWIGNKVFAAKCYLAIGAAKAALPLLEEAVLLPASGQDETEGLKEARELLEKHR